MHVSPLFLMPRYSFAGLVNVKELFRSFFITRRILSVTLDKNAYYVLFYYDAKKGYK